MEDFNWFGFIVWTFCVWMVLRIVRGYLEAKNAQLEKDLNELKTKIKEKIIKVNIEKHGEVFYLFEKETDRFIAQGKDADEIKNVLQNRYPDKTVFADKEHLETVGLKL